ncbi:MAG: biotin/lipoate A/B protein ligase family protein [Candidatus Bathyarchaeota archaeon]|nr:biotin/lipoate A/B protein ligase family protein [Candidatus Bathyarchaeota archaeon]
MNSWRLIKLGTYDAYTNMAIDEAILTAKICNLAPNTIRFYSWKPSAVSIGKFQDIQNEVNIENCKKYGVDVVRRITGGGTVYHDAEGEITYSVIADKKALKAKDITEVYQKIYAGIVEALKILGINADFNQGDAKTCPNLTVNGKKISGSAQSHKSGIVLQHGTLLLDVNLEKMFTFLRVPWAKKCMEIVTLAKNKITSIKENLGKNVSKEEVTNALTHGFQKALNIQLIKGNLTSYEIECARKLIKEKYATKEWNFKGKTLAEK